MEINELLEMTNIPEFAEHIGMPVKTIGSRVFTLSPDGFRRKIADETGAPFTKDESFGSCVFVYSGIYDFAMGGHYESAIDMATDFRYSMPAYDEAEKKKRFIESLELLKEFNNVSDIRFKSRSSFFLTTEQEKALSGRKLPNIIRYSATNADYVYRKGFGKCPYYRMKNGREEQRFEFVEGARDYGQHFTLRQLAENNPEIAKKMASAIAGSRIEAMQKFFDKPTPEIIEIMSENGIAPYEFQEFLQKRISLLEKIKAEPQKN